MPHDQPYSMLTANLVRSVRVLHVSPEGTTSRADVAATEEPMEVRVDGEPLAVIMRTPGADHQLTAGFLFSEGVITCAGDIESLERDPRSANVMQVRIREARSADIAARAVARRRVLMNSSCGLCGRVTIESLRVHAPMIVAEWTVPARLIETLPEALRRAQAVFDETGGLHGAGLFDRSGALDVVAEDVGRHNAVDKVIGRMLLDARLPLDQSILFVSGRTSYEIVQKAFLAGIPVVGAVSAPSSLAVELADDAGMTLLGFVRGATFNVYSHRARVAC
ncbi:MAG TPA: formate dehydrogenase accessory sulfurtransferase FdhD [Vicinamibacterales bacterium]|nr:formate dehydrogenase accessory sulfurtransferase FdhD [Vicinamibacterales bacterium]